MTQAPVSLVDSDYARRARIAHALTSAGRHVEPFENLQEFSAKSHDRAVLLVHDEGAMVQDVIEWCRREGQLVGVLAYSQNPSPKSVVQAIRWGATEREETEHREFVEHIIDFLEIQAYRKTPVGQLPYGLQKRVDLGRALALEPQVLLLDEPMAGMNLEEKQDMCRFILDVNDEFGTTIVLIEHDMGVVMDISDRVVVLDYGKKIGDGAPDEVRNNEDVIRAYLGTSH